MLVINKQLSVIVGFCGFLLEYELRMISACHVDLCLIRYYRVRISGVSPRILFLRLFSLTKFSLSFIDFGDDGF